MNLHGERDNFYKVEKYVGRARECGCMVVVIVRHPRKFLRTFNLATIVPSSVFETFHWTKSGY